MKDINLLLEEDKRVQQGEIPVAKPVKTVGKVAVAVVVTAMALATLVGPKLYAKTLELELASIKDQMKSEKYQEAASVKSQLAAAEQQLSDKKSIIKSIDEQAFPVNDILNTIKNNTPKGCAINDIQYTADTLKLSIKVEEIYNVAEFLLNMDRLKNIKLSDNSNTIKMNTNGDYVFNFEVGQKDGE